MSVLQRAAAKLTWTLEVVGRRDDGYHLLRSEMVSLALADDIVIDENGSGCVFVDGAAAPVAHLIDPVDNLVTKALDLVGRSAGVVVTKRIPVGGGLGGGSSDAAAILRWAGVLDADVAVILGGDVPFCLRGGRALVEGVGERITRWPDLSRQVTLILPDFGVSTPACYRMFDDMWAGGWRPRGRNHLFEPALQVEPRLARARDFIEDLTGRPVELCGSGSTMFIEGVLPGDREWDVQGPDGSIHILGTETSPAVGA